MASLAVESTTASVEAELYERHSDLVFRYCLRMLGSREDAEDAAQTTFVQALRAMRRGVVPAFEQAWLLAIARNECKSRYRAGSRRREREFTADPHALADLAEAPNGGDGRLVGVRQALGRLPENQRRALLLREWQGRSYEEIARELGTTRPAVEALLFRARRGLARELGEETTTRKHAFDLASLLAALKSFLSGGAAVKLAAGVAAIATVGTVAAGARQGTPLPTRARDVAAVERPAATPVGVSAPVAADRAAPTPRPKAKAKAKARAGTGSGSRAVARRAKPKTSTPVQGPAASAPATPGTAQAPPGAGSPGAPVTPPVVPAGTPDVPSLPAPPQPPPLVPSIETPQLPTVPPLPEVPQVQLPPVQVPQVQVPQVELPQVEVPEVPVVEDLPVVDDLLP